MGDQNHPANEDKIQTPGREANAAQPLNASENEGGAERYPPVRQDDAVETGEAKRTFDRGSEAESQQDGDGDITDTPDEDKLGIRGDPAEGRP